MLQLLIPWQRNNYSFQLLTEGHKLGGYDEMLNLMRGGELYNVFVGIESQMLQPSIIW